MAFIDNSGDIILDAVLTDLGRRRLAEGKFNIVRFALGDDEINYGLYNINHPSGSAYYDLEILQTPVFEAFTNNISSMNSRLVTYNNDRLEYLPVFKLNTNGVSAETSTTAGVVKCGVSKTTFSGITNVFLVAVDDTTRTQLQLSTVLGNSTAFINGSTEQHSNYIRIDQGIDSTAVASTKTIDPNLLEEEYTVEIDNRFGYLTFNNQRVFPTFVDDDDVALYNFSQFNSLINNVNVLSVENANEVKTKNNYAIAGSRGTCLSFGVFANEQLQIANSTYWFDKVGISVTEYNKLWKIIHTTVTVTGLKTGYSIDIPVSFIRYISG